jgi:hypothetical protein
MGLRRIARAILAVFAALSLLAALFCGWAFYEFYWRWRNCFNELGRCFDPATDVVMTDASFVWAVLAGVALVPAIVCWWVRSALTCTDNKSRS